ncbi:hypothetical protein CM318V1_610010 [Carnobacterium maltaromaticum]|nr:hypothetical protein CM318V1_610010 [Carnobacterium maltaromaticum]
MSKIRVENLTKVFGKKSAKALAMLKDNKSKKRNSKRNWSNHWG